MKTNRSLTCKGFTFIELMVVVLLIAGLSLFAVPKFKEAQKRQNSARSGQNLKTINSAVTQWDIENSGPPDQNGANPVRPGSEGWDIEVPAAGNSGLCDAILVYVEDTAGIWTSPNQPEVNCYIYSTYLSRGTVKGIVQSILNGDVNYEPAGYEGKTFPSSSGDQPQVIANGYEDIGRWEPGIPDVMANFNYP